MGKGENWNCRDSAKDYLECRMEHELMTKEDWKKLGYQDPAKKESTSAGSNVVTQNK